MGNRGIITIIFNGKKIQIYKHNESSPEFLGSQLIFQLRKIFVALTKNPVHGIFDMDMEKDDAMSNLQQEIDSMHENKASLEDILDKINLAMKVRSKEHKKEKQEMNSDKEVVYSHNILEVFKKHLSEVKLVNDKVPPTKEEIHFLKRYANQSVGSKELSDWYVLLRNCQGNIISILQVGYALSEEYDPEENNYIVDCDKDEFHYNGKFIEKLTTIKPNWYEKFYDFQDNFQGEQGVVDMKD